MPVKQLQQLQAREWMVVKHADQDVTNSATLTADLELFVPVAANASYLVEALILYSGNDATGDYQYNFTYPSSLPRGYGIEWNTSDASTGLFGIGGIAASTSLSARSIGTDAADTTRQMMNRIFFRVGAAGGTLQYQFAQAVATPATHARTKAGSTLYVRRMPSF